MLVRGGIERVKRKTERVRDEKRGKRERENDPPNFSHFGLNCNFVQNYYNIYEKPTLYALNASNKSILSPYERDRKKFVWVNEIEVERVTGIKRKEGRGSVKKENWFWQMTVLIWLQ